MDKWLSRFSFSFFIIAALLVWEAYMAMTGRRGTVPEWRIGLYLLASVISITLGALGVRARHRTRL